MPGDPIISIRHVSKVYRIWDRPLQRLTSPIINQLAGFLPAPGWRQRLRTHASAACRDFHALRDVSFDIRRGEAWGIIGRNGSGKSTLLQIIAGTLQATHGEVRVHGRIAAMLELGSGFNPEFTGRENVMLSGAILGISREEMEMRYKEIVAFADIGDFIDQPIKTYSSGMLMRIAFAVNSLIMPDILIVDEALSVGDAPFQAKCYARIQQMREQGTTILFVSHEIGAVRSFCQHAVWLKEGATMVIGDVKTACDAYQRDCWRASGMQIAEDQATAAPAARAGALAGAALADRKEFEKNAALGRQGEGPVRLLNFLLVDTKGQRIRACRFDEHLQAVYVLTSLTGFNGLFQIGLTVKTIHGTEVLSVADRTQNQRMDIQPGQEIVTKLNFSLPLKSGKYYVTTGIFSFPDNARFSTGTYDFMQSTVMDRVEYGIFIEMEPQTNLGIHGPVHQEGALEIIPLVG